MRIHLNGEKTESNCQTLLDLVLEQGFNPGSLIVEFNYKVLRQESWADTAIRDGDNVEVLSFVGGG